jgi:hypothetical protein
MTYACGVDGAYANMRVDRTSGVFAATVMYWDMMSL